MDDAQMAAEIEALLDEESAADRFSGAVLLARGGRPLLTAARGYAVHPKVRPNHTGTRFNLASVTKMLTAVAVMKLVQSGKLDLHTPVAAYDPALPHADRVSVHQLLTHTAGFDYYWNEAYRAARSDLRTIAGYLRLFTETPLLFEPGTRHHYCSCGYVVLGALIESVTGESYYDHMQSAVYGPTDMPDTGHFELDLPDADRAAGYTLQNWFGPVDGRRRSNDFIYAVKGSPSEHCFSTVGDLFNFLQALQSRRLLDEVHTQLCFTPHAAAEQPGVHYGYGFHIIDDGKHGRVVGHGGRALGGDAFALIYCDLGYDLVVLSNYDRPAARRIMDRIADWMIA